MIGLNRIFEIIDGYRDEVIRIQTELTSRVALGPDNGGSGEHDKTAFIKDLLEKLGPDSISEYRAPDERARDGYRPNLVAAWGEEEEQPTVWVLSHSDVVPPGDPALWDQDPYVVKVDGDRLIGRGVEDNQHGFVSSYLALKAVLDSGLRPKRRVGLAVVADEETGSRFGLDFLVKHHRELFKEHDLIVVPDVGNDDGTMIEVAEKSMLWMKFIVTGRQCHGSTPQKGRNSLSGAAKLIVALEELRRRFPEPDGLFSPSVSTFEPTRIEANIPNVNTIPGRDVFYMDCRILPRYRTADVLSEARDIAESVGRDLALDMRIEAVHQLEASKPTPEDSPVVKELAEAVFHVTGRTAEPKGIGGGTVAVFFRKAGLPAAVWCTMPETAHQPNEYTLISNNITDAKTFACLYMGMGKA